MEFTEEQVRRYARHILLPQVGGRGQARLLAGSALVSGLGGRAAWWSALYLAAAGLGRVGAWEPEGEKEPELLPLFLPAGAIPWGDALRRQLGALNPEVRVEICRGREAGPLVRAHDLAVLGSWDEAGERVASAFWGAGKPALAGEARGWRGWVAAAVPGGHAAPGERPVSLSPPQEGGLQQKGGFRSGPVAGGVCPPCLAARGVEFLPADAGPGPEPCAAAVGSLLALEAIKALLDIGGPRRGRVYKLDLWDLRLAREEPPPTAGCASCGADAGGGAGRPPSGKERP